MGQDGPGTRKHGSRQRRITPDEHDEIIEGKLTGLSERAIAKDLGINRKSVVAHWHTWLDEDAVMRREHLERYQTDVVARLEHAAHRCRKGAARATDPAAEGMFIRTELRALQQLARIMGMEKFHITGVVESIRLPSPEEARAALDKLPKYQAPADPTLS
jgi:hypothetical protein